MVSMNLILLFTAIQGTAFDLDFYEQRYQLYNVIEDMGLPKEVVMDATKEILNYLKDERVDLEVKFVDKGIEQSFFNEKEKQHMVDVQFLFNQGFLIRNISIGFFLLGYSYLWKTVKNKRYICKIFILGTVIPVVFLFISIGIISLDFDKYFTYFHEIFFTNDLWLLDPTKDRLIQMLPLDFFSDAALRIGISYIFGLLFIGLTNLLLLHKNKKRKTV